VAEIPKQQIAVDLPVVHHQPVLDVRQASTAATRKRRHSTAITEELPQGKAASLLIMYLYRRSEQSHQKSPIARKTISILAGINED